ncbi:hypothetical protein FTO74_13005 [Granulicella sp. WH15]|uniref:hypothetical protein n=1 Tax=Granulicella sp. WH15 TaxID=2602070 RepID=UPI0013674876|nr:hypothetical protein [Granulicella sp. WH15]QHN04183.1 hypothetical protein FTO74_13005 [Granulicella sp. WH15]
MDSVRFGRALGTGAREAARALLNAADAASSPNPSTPPQPASQPTAKPAPTPRVAQVIQTTRGVREGSRRFGEAVWKPTVRASGIIWLEVTGTFFSLFVIVGSTYCWSHRAALHGGTPEAQRGFWVMAAMTLLFGYFCLSSFLRAKRRARS